MRQPHTNPPRTTEAITGWVISITKWDLLLSQIPRRENWARNFCRILAGRGHFLPRFKPNPVRRALDASHGSPARLQSVNFAFL